MESTPIVKKARAPRVKKQFTEPVIEIVDIPKLQTQVVNDMIEEQLPITVKQDVIFSVDPGFVKCGYAVICSKTGEYINSYTVPLRPAGKLTQGEVDGHLGNNIRRIMNEILEQYNVTHFVVELQLGSFSVDKVQLAFILALPDNIPYTVQHSKLKLKHPELKECVCPNEDSVKYNQNKQMGRLLCERLFKETRGRESSFDEMDALLHAKYVFRNMNSIKFTQKKDLK